MLCWSGGNANNKNVGNQHTEKNEGFF